MAAMNVRRRLKCDRGSELVEFALILPLLLVVVMGVVDFGFLFQRYEVLTNAAREGARIAALPDYDEDDVKNRVSEYLSGTGMTVTTEYIAPAYDRIPTTGSCITLAGAKVTYNHTFIAIGPLIKLMTRGSTSILTSKTLTVTAKMRSEAGAITCP